MLEGALPQKHGMHANNQRICFGEYSITGIFFQSKWSFKGCYFGRKWSKIYTLCNNFGSLRGTYFF